MKPVVIASLLIVAAVAAAHVTPAEAKGRRACKAKFGTGCIEHLGNSGWVKFCNGDEVVNTTKGDDMNCVVMRPFRYSEVDAAGESIKGTEINKLAVASKGDATTYTLAKCNGTSAAETMEACCSNASVKLTKVHLVVPLEKQHPRPKAPTTASNASNTMDLVVFVAQESCENIYYHGESAPLPAGQFKFDINVADFTPTGGASSTGISFDFIIKIRGKDKFQLKKKEGKKEFVVGDGAMVNFGSYTRGTADRKVAADVGVKAVERGNVQVLSFTFTGDKAFKSIQYDPTVNVPAYTEESGAIGVSSVLAALCTLMVAVAVAMM